MVIDLNSDEAEKGKPAIVQFGDNANQIAVARTLMGFIYMHLTDALGPLPYTEAFQAGEENFTPVFDSQETIYAKLDADLREAYNLFNESGSLSTADILFDGDIRAWKKLNASTRMMLAIKLADVDPAEGRSRFAQAYADGGIEEKVDRHPTGAGVDAVRGKGGVEVIRAIGMAGIADIVVVFRSAGHRKSIVAANGILNYLDQR